MSITNGYTDKATFKLRFFPSNAPSDVVDDAMIDSVITAASRKIDQYCNRRFWVTSSDEVRYFTAEWPDLLRIDDMPAAPTEIAIDISGNRTYSIVWDSTDYDMEPYNAPLETPVRPYTQIRRQPYGKWAFPVGYHGQAIQRAGVHKGVRITGKFGFCALANVPDGVREACILQSIRWFKRRDAIFGIMGSGDMGTIFIPGKAVFTLDPDISFMLEDFRKLEGMRGA